MKKIGILTLNGYFNYGNRLQNYASQEVLKSLGFSVETIINNSEYKNKSIKNYSVKDRIQNLSKLPANELYEKIKFKSWYSINKKKIEDYKIKRKETFKEFTKKYISETDYSISDDNVPADLADRYDYFVTGSDQVWNPNFRYGSPIDFLTFAPKNKRIAYAPSFGISEIPAEYIEKYKIWLSQINKLSVREETGAKIIKDLTGRDAVVLVDPTIMLTKEMWLSISRVADNKPKSEYLLTYFLGKVSKEKKVKIETIADENNLAIVNLADIRDEETYITGPSEFIDYVNSASVFFTDSFHGAVFSILMETPFVVFDRVGNHPSMNSRIETLLTMFRLSSRKANNIVSNNQVFEADYSHVQEILENERKKTIEYLKDALNVTNEVEYEN